MFAIFQNKNPNFISLLAFLKIIWETECNLAVKKINSQVIAKLGELIFIDIDFMFMHTQLHMTITYDLW